MGWNIWRKKPKIEDEPKIEDDWLAKYGTNRKEIEQVLVGLQQVVSPGNEVPLKEIAFRIEGLAQLKNFIETRCQKQAKEEIASLKNIEDTAYYSTAKLGILKRMLQEALGLV